MKSSLKVGILAISAIIILLFTVMWIKGKAISKAERITISFKDVNGMRQGSGVQMMGVRIGQVEEIIPRINSAESYVDIKFVITEPNIKIPTASEISIQQSGIIGELFLEITPPKEQVIYLSEYDKNSVLHADDKVEMQLDGKYYDVGVIKKIEIVETNLLPVSIRENIKTKHAYKVKYIVNLPGLKLPRMLDGKIIKANNEKKLRIKPKEDIVMQYPKTTSPYTIIEPMRLADFLVLQSRSANSLIETNERLSMLLSDDVIRDLQKSAVNVKDLTEQAGVTIAKAQELIELSKNEIEILSEKVNTLADNINKIAGDKEFVANINDTAKSVKRLSDNMSDLMEDPKTKSTLKNLEVTSKNIAELSTFVNDMSKDAQLKQYLKETVAKMNAALDKLCTTLDTVNYATEDREKVKQTMDDISESSENLRKFSEKLNKRFLIFRLLF